MVRTLFQARPNSKSGQASELAEVEICIINKYKWGEHMGWYKDMRDRRGLTGKDVVCAEEQEDLRVNNYLLFSM